MKMFKNEVAKFVGAVIGGAASFALISLIVEMVDYDTPCVVCGIFLAIVAYICVKGAELGSMLYKKFSEGKKGRKEKEIEEIAMKVAMILRDQKIEV